MLVKRDISGAMLNKVLNEIKQGTASDILCPIYGIFYFPNKLYQIISISIYNIVKYIWNCKTRHCGQYSISLLFIF